MVGGAEKHKKHKKPQKHRPYKRLGYIIYVAQFFPYQECNYVIMHM